MAEPVYLPALHEVSPMRSGLRIGAVHATVEGAEGRDPLHLHGYAEIFYNVAGEVTFLADGRLYTDRPGEGILCPAGCVHVCRIPEGTRQEHYCLWLGGENLEELLPTRTVFSLGEKAKRAEELLACLARGEAPLLETAHLCELLLLFHGGKQETPSPAALPASLGRVLADLRESFATVGTVEALAARHYMSCPTLTRLFRRHLGITPKSYLESLKLSHAAEVLESGASVTEAALRSGFSDCSHFIALFRRRFGETPLRFRRRLLESRGEDRAVCASAKQKGIT